MFIAMLALLGCQTDCEMVIMDEVELTPSSEGESFMDALVSLERMDCEDVHVDDRVVGSIKPDDLNNDILIDVADDVSDGFYELEDFDRVDDRLEARGVGPSTAKIEMSCSKQDNEYDWGACYCEVYIGDSDDCILVGWATNLEASGYDSDHFGCH